MVSDGVEEVVTGGSESRSHWLLHSLHRDGLLACLLGVAATVHLRLVQPRFTHDLINLGVASSAALAGVDPDPDRRVFIYRVRHRIGSLIDERFNQEDLWP